MEFFKDGIKLFLFFCLTMINISYSQVFNNDVTDVYGFQSHNGILGNLSGPGKYVAIPPNAALNPELAGTVEAWIYLNSLNPNDSYILQKGTLLEFGITGAGKIFLKLNNTSFVTDTTVQLNSWVHVAASWINFNPNFHISLFKNGNQVANIISPAVLSANSDSLTIGGSRLTPGSYLNGYVDEVRLWNTLSDVSRISTNRFVGLGGEASANFDSAITGGQIYNGLKASWTFNIFGQTVFENINNYNGYLRGGAQQLYTNIQGQPIPYNLALYFPGRAIDYVKVADNSALNLSSGGTIELWIATVGTSTPITILAKGNTLGNTSYRLFIDASGILKFQIGPNNIISGPLLPASNWFHIAVAWSYSSGTYTVKFYLNGQFTGENTITTVMPVNTSELRFGSWQWDENTYFTGWMDEIRIWSREMTNEEIKINMFNSVRSETLTGPLAAAWDFEGNLRNYLSVGLLYATFKTDNPSGRSGCRFSGYNAEFVGGPLTDFYDAHSTTINRGDNPDNPFPAGFSIRVPNKTIDQFATVYDTIYIPGNVSLSVIEVFLSLQHPNIGGIVVKLKAPNGQERILENGTGGYGRNILTFFKDGQEPLTEFYPPWSYLAGPFNSFGNFGNTAAQGNWVLSIQHSSSMPSALLLGWGLRINNSITGISSVSNIIPGKFELFQCYPNPFNPSTEFKFNLPIDVNVKISIFDLLGKEIDVITDEFRKAGEYKVKYDAGTLSSGVYFYTIKAGSFSDSKKMILIK
ncbi:MAG: LamG-like jellyroll fold domain-containing protein [Ignavibacteria bacterium]